MVAIATCSLFACSLIVDTSGLSGGAVGPPNEAGLGVASGDVASSDGGLDGTSADASAFGQYINVTRPSGAADTLQNVLGSLGPTATTHHVEVLAKTTGANVTVDSTIDGRLLNDPVVLRTPPQSVVFRCGIPFASQVAPTGPMSSTTVKVENPEISVCP